MGCCKSKQDSSAKVLPVEADECGPVFDSPKGKSLQDSSASQPSQEIKQHDSRIAELEATVKRQAEQLQALEKSLGIVARDGRNTVSVLQYNILASYLGQNTQPWFLYGAEVSSADRKRVLARYQERDEKGQPKYSWPKYAEGILPPEDIRAVEERDEDFKWPKRRQRLTAQIRELDADVVSLVELDEHGYFAQQLGDVWDTAFHKRPRAVSHDGCGVFWRRSKFSRQAHYGFDFIDEVDQGGENKRDRSCLMVLLRWRSDGSPLVVVSTHLAKNPECRSQTALRVRQVMQIMEGLTDFTKEHDAFSAPVILLGDLNARHFKEIRGLARTVWQVRGTPIHNFLWRASDVPTGPTSVTKARQCRIDVVQFLSSQLEVIEVKAMAKLEPGQVIPNSEHPSDHLPVWVRFRAKDNYQTHKETARAWLECVAGREKLHPLTESELEIAFQFFDRDRCDKIQRYDLEEACMDLGSNVNVDVQSSLIDCFPDRFITYENFVKAYEVRFTHERMRCIGELEYAFGFFAKDGKKISISKLEEIFREITPISFTDDEIEQMIGRLNLQPGQEYVDLRSFCEVICKSSFPHKRRRGATVFTPNSTQDSRSTGRRATAEIAYRLDLLQRSAASGTLNGTWGGLTNELKPTREEDEDSEVNVT